MFGSKLRSWMEAVRPRKKQHRKEKQTKSNLNSCSTVSPSNWQNGGQDDLLVVGKGNTNRKIGNGLTETGQSGQAPTRYSANNLSSPESAYSTGYSTDGTSPGAPPDYYINIRTEGERCNHEQLQRYPQPQRVSNGVDAAARSKQPPPAVCVPSAAAGRRLPNMVICSDRRHLVLDYQSVRVRCLK
jgi:hypothetical protein